MDHISLWQLSNCTWYAMNMVVYDEKENVLFDGCNSQFQSDIYKPLLGRWVRSVGCIDGKMVVHVI